MITAIIFDFGNVVLTNDWHDGIPEKRKEFFDYFGVSYSGTNRGWNAAWPRLRTGKITENEFWKIFLQAAGAKKADIRKAKATWRKYQRPLENMLGLIVRKLHADLKECLFVDNQAQNLMPAKKLGMKTILFKNQADLEKRLRKLGIEF